MAQTHIVDADKGVHESSSNSSVLEAPSSPAIMTHSNSSWDLDAHRAALEDNPEAPQRLTFGAALAVFFLGLSFVGPLGAGFLLVTAILEPIGLALGDTEHIVWIAGGWSVAGSVSFSIAGGLSDVFGRRNLVLAGQVFSLIGAIVAATAQTTKHVVAGSTIVGFGSGFTFVAYAAIQEMIPNKYRGIAIGWTEGCINLPWGGFCVIIGQLLVVHASWRWTYYISIIYSAISVVGLAAFYWPPPRPRKDFEKTRWEEFKELDFIGMFLYTAGLTSLLIAFTWAGQEGHAWKSASVVAPLILGFFGVLACFIYDFTVAKTPLFPYVLFSRMREFTLLLVVSFVAGMVFYSMAVLLPQLTLYTYTSDGIQIGIIEIPNGVGPIVGGFIMPMFAHKFKHIRLQIVAALVIQTIFVALYSVATPGHKAAWMAFQFFGMGCFTWITCLLYLTIALHSPQKYLGIAVGMIGTFRSAGGAVGTAIFNTILDSEIDKHLAPNIIDAALQNGFPASQLEELVPAVIEHAVGIPGVFAKIPAATPAVQAATQAAFRHSYAYAFQRVAWSCIPFGVIAICCAWFIADPSKYLTNHVSVQLEREVFTAKKDNQDLVAGTEKGVVETQVVEKS